MFVPVEALFPNLDVGELYQLLELISSSMNKWECIVRWSLRHVISERFINCQLLFIGWGLMTGLGKFSVWWKVLSPRILKSFWNSYIVNLHSRCPLSIILGGAQWLPKHRAGNHHKQIAMPYWYLSLQIHINGGTCSEYQMPLYNPVERNNRNKIIANI